MSSLANGEWQGYPNVGADPRNVFDLMRALPGGLAGIRSMVADFHRRGVRVLWPNFPWDLGTRDEGSPDYRALVELVLATGADGANGDTMDCLPRPWMDLATSAALPGRRPLALQPQSMGTRYDKSGWQAIGHNVMSWGEGWQYTTAPLTSAYKLLEPRHMVNVVERQATNRTDGLQTAFFNAVGCKKPPTNPRCVMSCLFHCIDAGVFRRVVGVTLGDVQPDR